LRILGSFAGARHGGGFEFTMRLTRIDQGRNLSA
jgi:hypothetical protein